MLRCAIASLSLAHPQSLTLSHTWRSFFASVARSNQEPSRHENSQNLSESPSNLEADDSLREGNVINRAPSDTAAEENASPAHAPAHTIRTHPRTRTRLRTLRPILIAPSFPPTLLQNLHLAPYSHDQQAQENDDRELSESHDAVTTIVLTSLPPNTLKTDIRPVLQHFGEVMRILVRPDGRRAEVVFTDAHAVARTLHAYAERPIRVRGREVIVYRKRMGRASGNSSSHALGGGEQQEGHGVGFGKGTIFVSGFPPETTQEDLAEALQPLGKYEGLVMRMSMVHLCLFFFVSFLDQSLA